MSDEIIILPTHVNELHVGIVIGHLKLVRRLPIRKTGSPSLRRRWRVVCQAPGCNNSDPFTVPQNYLVRKPSPKTHCGCMNRTLRTDFNREYRIWTMMRTRCSDERHHAYKDYGGRGIRVCDEWFVWDTGFEAFLEYIGPSPSLKYSVDRIDVDGNYAPGNVRWATAKEQANNTRKNKHAKENKKT